MLYRCANVFEWTTRQNMAIAACIYSTAYIVCDVYKRTDRHLFERKGYLQTIKVIWMIPLKLFYNLIYVL